MFDYAFLSENEMINIILSKNEELKIAYEIYQEILITIEDKKFKRFKNIIEKYLEYIENSLNYKYNNGVIEEIDRKIKTLKRVAYGYKSFYHFRARILICNNLLAVK